MGRFKFYDVEFIVDEDINDLKEFLQKTNVTYCLSNCYQFEYVGIACKKNENSKFNLGKRLIEHARKISLNSEEKVYRNGLAKSKRVRLRILGEFESPKEARMCEHNTIINRRREIAEARGYSITFEEAKNSKNSYLWDDILLNVNS